MTGLTPFKATGTIAATPRESAMLSMQQNNENLAKLGKVQGGQRRTKKGGATNMVQVPPVPMNGLHDPAGGTSQGLGSQITNTSKITLNNQAQSALDSKVTLVPIPKGGKRKTKHNKIKSNKMKRSKRKVTHRKKYGGATLLRWPCLSGGKSRRKNKK
uniref:Uncharacterized protein n=1 Tax=viral metagenome TaxID=1070528 RepID=A0A6C0B169_9ZZZZ